MSEKLICPVCRMELAYPLKHCPHCSTTVFDETKEGERIFLDPAALDRSKKYRVHGLVNGQLRKGYTEFYPGDLVQLPDDPRMRMTDISVYTYVDGGRFNRKFLMPMRDIAITTGSTGMMQNAPIRYTGPYGERLRCEVYAPENILRDDEPDPAPQRNPMSLMGTTPAGGMQGLQAVMGAQAAPAAPGEEWICECGAKNTGRFCRECGLPKPCSSGFQ